MHSITFITGNAGKAAYLAELLGLPIKHQKVDLDEIQSLDLADVTADKARRAYAIVKGPVLVEDVSLEFSALGRLPGTLIKWFVEELPFETICSLLDGKDRSATARCVFAYYDGNDMKLFEGSMPGRIAEQPAGSGGYGWDPIFIPDGYAVTRAELSKEDDHKVYMRTKPIAAVRAFLETL